MIKAPPNKPRQGPIVPRMVKPPSEERIREIFDRQAPAAESPPVEEPTSVTPAPPRRAPSYGYGVSISGPEREKALCVALVGQDWAEAQKFIDEGANVDQRLTFSIAGRMGHHTDFSGTPLTLVTESRDLTAVEFLLDNNASIAEAYQHLTCAGSGRNTLNELRRLPDINGTHDTEIRPTLIKALKGQPVESLPLPSQASPVGVLRSLKGKLGL